MDGTYMYVLHSCMMMFKNILYLESCHAEKLDDISELLNIESAINADDFLKELSQDLEVCEMSRMQCL